jgi:hypothetical protein
MKKKRKEEFINSATEKKGNATSDKYIIQVHWSDLTAWA